MTDTFFPQLLVTFGFLSLRLSVVPSLGSLEWLTWEGLPVFSLETRSGHIPSLTSCFSGVLVLIFLLLFRSNDFLLQVFFFFFSPQQMNSGISVKLGSLWSDLPPWADIFGLTLL